VYDNTHRDKFKYQISVLGEFTLQNIAASHHLLTDLQMDHWLHHRTHDMRCPITAEETATT